MSLPFCLHFSADVGGALEISARRVSLQRKKSTREVNSNILFLFIHIFAFVSNRLPHAANRQSNLHNSLKNTKHVEYNCIIN